MIFVFLTLSLDGYTDAASNRSEFPLSNGLIKLDNHHSEWSGNTVPVTPSSNVPTHFTFLHAAAVLISIEQNPTNFEVFNTSSSGIELPLAVDWFTSSGAGEICIPVDVASLGIEGVGDGSNVTLQAMFTGGDGNLFQVIFSPLIFAYI